MAGQDVRPKDVRETAKGGSAAMPKLQELLKNPDRAVRLEAVKQITEIGTARSLDPLIAATHDNDPEIQMLATDGLVNFYSPGYVKTGIAGSLRRVGTSIKGKFTDTNDLVIDAFVEVRPEVIAALAQAGDRRRQHGLARQRRSRRWAFCAARPRSTELLEGVHSKDTDLIYESLVALQKIRDQSAAPAHRLPSARPRPQGADRGDPDHRTCCSTRPPCRT